MKTVVLAFDIERTGAKPFDVETNVGNETIAIGISVVDENLKQLDSLLIKGYIPRPITDEPATISNAPEGFEPRSWVEFWHDKRDHLKKLALHDVKYTPEDKELVERVMIVQFQAFRRNWEARAEAEGFNLEVCSDNPTYDCWFINDMICRHTNDHPLPYKASRVEYKSLWDSDSMLRGALAVDDPSFKGPWGASTRIREIYHVVPENIGYDHMPHHDAYNIACDAQIVLGIREKRFIAYRSFVAVEDEQRIVEIVKKIKNNTLRKETSVLVIYGDGSNGKSTFVQMLSQLVSAGRAPVDFFEQKWNYTGPQPLVKEINEDLVIIGETANPNKAVEKIQEFIRINEGNSARMPYNPEPIIINPGVFIIVSNEMPSFNVERWRRNPEVLHFPFKY